MSMKPLRQLLASLGVMDRDYVDDYRKRDNNIEQRWTLV